LKVFISLFFTVFLLGGIFEYLKYQESNYNFLINQAEKSQRDHSEFSDFDGQIEPKIPDLQQNSKTLLGIDLNSNGIRDDVDVWINRKSFDSDERRGMRQLAEAYQKWLEGCGHSDRTEEKNIIAARSCLHVVSDYQRGEEDFVAQKIELLVFNTKERLDCKNMNESKILFQYKELTSYCHFKMKYPENVWNFYEIWLKKNNKI
jgi:hypothetical protein